MKLNKNARKLLLDVVWGDGYVKENGSINLKHGPKQLPYLEWKVDLLRSAGVKVSDIMEVQGKWVGYQAYIPVTKWGKFLRRSLYDGSMKNIYQPSWLKRMDAQRLALWYMDDGGLGHPKRNGKVTCTQLGLYTSATKEQNQLLSDYFREQWGVSFYICKGGRWTRLICGTKQARKFVEIVRPYVEQVPCMRYKLDVKPLVTRNGCTLK